MCGPFVGVGAHNIHDLGDVFTYAGASGGEGPVAMADFAKRTGSCSQTVTTASVAGGIGIELSVASHSPRRC